jgi:hypothetical protein
VEDRLSSGIGSMRKNICHTSPYLDNEFLLVARTKQDSKKFYFIKRLQNFIYFIV